MTRFDLRQRVQTRSRRVVPFTTARTRWRSGYQRRFVLLFAWLMLCPVMGPLPQISHTRAMGLPDERNERLGHLLDRVHIVPADLLDQHSLTTVVRDAKPDEIYNLAAQSFVPTSWTQPVLT